MPSVNNFFTPNLLTNSNIFLPSLNNIPTEINFVNNQINKEANIFYYEDIEINNNSYKEKEVDELLNKRCIKNNKVVFLHSEPDKKRRIKSHNSVIY
jgi:hypothetical protein